MTIALFYDRQIDEITRRPHSAGYTYMGVLLAVALIGTGLAVTGEVWSTARQRDREAALLHLGSQFRGALLRYAADGGSYPARLEDLLKDPRFPGVRRYLRVIPRDPVTGRIEWGLVRGPRGGIVGVHSLSGGRPLKQAGFSRQDRALEGRQRYSEWVFGVSEAAAAATPPEGAASGTTLAHGTGLQSGAAQNKQR